MADKPKPIKKQYQKMVAGETKKIAPMKKVKVPTAGEEYHRKRKEKESKSYGVAGGGGSKREDEKKKSKQRVAQIAEMRERLKANRPKMNTKFMARGKPGGFAAGFNRGSNR